MLPAATTLASTTASKISVSTINENTNGISEGAVCKPHVSGVGISTVVGKVFAGHFSPVHKEPDVIPMLRDIFTTYDVVTGDFNANPFHLDKHDVSGLHTCSERNTGTYLPNIPKPGYNDTIRLPQFDAIYVRRSTLRASPCKLVHCPTLPKSVRLQNPRLETKSRLGLDSDHIPVAATISTSTGTTSSITLMTYNIADPVFWAKYYPGVDAGFAPDDEPARQQRLLRFLEGACGALDVVCLQEVPVQLVPALEQLVADSSRGLVMLTSRSYCKHNPEDPDKSYLVVIARRSCMTGRRKRAREM